MDSPFKASSPVIQHRCVHLDLKGTPPKFQRLLELLDLFAALRFTAVLVEWEDAYPWTISLSFRSATAYSEEEVGQFVAHSGRLGLELIPLVQTLGHMENFLKGDDKIDLREVPTAVDVLNPLAKGASGFVQAIILDVLRLMPDVQRVHLGGDEAWTFGTHPQTKVYIEQIGAAALYLHHVEPLLELLNGRGIRPMLWNDMMVKWEDAELKRLAPQCDLVVWGYVGHPDHVEGHFHSRHIARFTQMGFTLWGGCAFKGADGHSCDRLNPAGRRFNAEAWVEIAQRYQFKGLITTGWSRYCFNAPQCESIEGSLDALLEQAILMHEGVVGETVMNDAETILASVWSQANAERFVKVRKAAMEYSEANLSLWYCIRLAETQLATSRLDPLRPPISFGTGLIPQELKKFNLAAQNYRSILESLIPSYWLNQYFSERLDAIMNLLGPYLYSTGDPSKSGFSNIE